MAATASPNPSTSVASPFEPPPPRRDAKPHSPWRRSACDRCRGQKLSCTRKADDPTGTCNRCERMHMSCSTSSPKKTVGRPPRKIILLEKENLSNHNNSSNNNGSNNSETAAIDDHVEPRPVDSRRSRNLDYASPGGIYLSWPFFHNDRQSVEINEDVPIPVPSDGANLNPAPTPSIDLSPEMANGYFSSPGEQNVLVYPPSIDTQSEGAGRSDANDVDPGVLLATLQQSLAKQAVFLRTSNWNSTDLSITAGTVTEASPDGSYHPLATILKSTTQLLNILQRLKSPSSIPELPPSQPPIFHVVTIITCYLLVISIFDTIFRQILVNQVDHSSQRAENSSAPSSAARPPIHPGSAQRGPELLFVPLTPRLRLRLLVQVVEHQLELLERALGLSHTDCVCNGLRDDAGDRAEDDGGIVDWPEMRVLFRTIIEADDSGPRGGGDGAIRQATATLRENLKIAQRATGKGVA